MEEVHSSRPPMAKTCLIIRRSIYTFLQNYQHFTCSSALLALPFSVSILLSQALLVPSSKSLFPMVYNRLHSLFLAAGFPLSSEFFAVLNLKLSQTISSSIFSLPFTFTFLLFAKASVIQVLKKQKPTVSSPSFSSVLSIFNPLLLTYLINTIFIISANATAFCLLFISFNFLEGFGFSSPNSYLLLSAAGAVIYSVILANALIICNCALVLSGIEKSGGYLAILKACIMIRGRTSTALSLALPAHIALAAVEALFHYRIVKLYHQSGKTASSMMVMEGMLIAYLCSIFIVLDTTTTFIFLKSCKTSSCLDEEYAYRIEMVEEDYKGCISSKAATEVP